MSSGMMPAQFFLTPDSYKETTKSEISGTLTNLPNIAGTWGKFIPTGWGNYRIGGYQIWSSPFYKITDTTTVSLVDNYATLNPSNMFQNALGMQNVFKGNEVYSERVSVDVAYSFGYNGLGGKSRVTRIRFDQNPIYDVNGDTSTTDYAFTVRYGNEDYPEPVMVSRASDPENVVYYPGQIVITFAGLEGAYLGTKNTKSPLPTSVDIDVIAITAPNADGGIMGDTIMRTYNPNNVDETWSDSVMTRMVNWKDAIMYEYNFYRTPQTIRHYKLPSLEVIKDVPINVNNGDTLNFRTMVYHEPSGLILAQHAGPGDDNFGYSAVFIIDPETGQQVDKFGHTGWTFSTPPGSGIAGTVATHVYSYKDDEIVLVGSTNQGSRTSYRWGMRKEGTAWKAFGNQTTGKLPSVFSQWSVGGKNGVSYHHIGQDIYIGDSNGFTKVFTIPTDDIVLGSGSEFMDTVGTDLVIARNDTIIRYTKTGQLVYKKQYRQGIEVPQNVYSGNPWGSWFNISAKSGARRNTDIIVGSYGNYHMFELNLATGDLTLHPVVLGPGFPNEPNSYSTVMIWDDVRGWAIDGGRNGISSSGTTNVPISVEGERILLRDFIRSLYVNTGRYTPEQIEFVDIEDTIVGALLVKPWPLDTIVNNTIRLYRIEKLETRDTIKFYRNRPIIGDSDIQYDIDLDNLALVKEGDDNRATLITTIGDTQKGFAEVKLSFIDYEADYNENSVVWRRPDAPADATQTLDLSTIIIMDKNEAQQLVQINFQDKISATTKHQLRLPPSYSDIYKGDILRVKHNKYTSVMRVTETTLNADHSVSVLADGAMLSVNALPPIPDKANFTVGAALGKGPTIVVPLDTNAIHPTHNFADGFAYYYLVYGTDPEWAGGYVTRSNSKMPERRLFEVDGSVKFAAYETANALGDKPWTLDEEPLQVTKIGGRWDAAKNTTVTELAKDKTKNLCFYGAPGRWEIMQVAAIVDGKATGIFRGMRGTESFCGLHVPGDKLLVIDEFLIAEKRALDNVGITDTLKSVSYSEKFEQATGTTVAVKANALKPFAPVFIEGTTEGEDVVLTWARRDRTGGSSFKPIPMSEATEEYEIDIIKGDEVLRTVTDLTDKTFTYTAAMRAEDETANDETLTLAVYQISAVVGRGYAGRATINV